MTLKWKILIAFVTLYLIGVAGGGWHTYDSTSASGASPVIEAIKVVFIMLGGLGVILPTYLNVWQSLETADLLSDQARRNKVENTFSLLEKWDSTSLFEARKFTRELKEQHSKLSPDELKEKINTNPDLKQSTILVFNYFEWIRISIENDRVDATVIGHSLGGVFHDMYDRFKPWIRDRDILFQNDLEKLSKLLPDPKP
jgi:hypothetical protein